MIQVLALVALLTLSGCMAVPMAAMGIGAMIATRAVDDVLLPSCHE
jgi:hypothetical protein